MSDDRSDEPKRLGTEDADAALTDRRSVAGALQPSSKPAIGGSSDGRDAALRSDTDRSDASSGTVEPTALAAERGVGRE